ncbi:rRNA-binding ribosome biosynthesis protein rpf2 [Vermiconidia calcicola]|uniref:rRNA-binding ribosome biosynthesis protein rpf2 n=1 Tax=Vermiconidia calcicola TaxID=1690605 RepID=A0ACC3NAF5_9PEZI|nr:rRNA-binding ribosome biosynthesis protein rpf2 [Vermiconidia calcicola]
MLPIRQIKPKNARTKRYLDNKSPQTTENPRTTLFLRYTTSSELLHLVTSDLHALKRPLAIKFTKKNDIHPFEDASSLEFFSEKNDASLMVYASHSKKRPHCLTLVRFFGFKVLDMVELGVVPETVRTLQQFKNKKATVGLKPLISFSGSAFESPVASSYTLAKSVLTDLFKGPDVGNVDVEGLQYMIHFSVDEEEGEVKPVIHMRCYLLKTKKSGTSLPKVEVEEMGPRIDFRMGRVKEAEPEMWKEAMRKPKGQEVKAKKNVDTDLIGDKVGRIHLGKQDLSGLQTRKMKGLKRSRDVADEGNAAFAGADEDFAGFVPESTGADKRVRVEEPTSALPQMFPLLELPPELRNRVYEFAVLSPHVVNLKLWDTNGRYAPWIDQSLVAQAPLTKTCRQIRAEALAIIFSSTVFLMGHYLANWAAVKPWLVAIGRENRARLRQVYIEHELDADECCYHGIAGEDVRLEGVLARDDVKALLGESRERRMGGKVLHMTFGQD